MVDIPDRGEIWWAAVEGVGRRPYLVMTRSRAIPVLNSVLAAPITRRIRSIPTEVRLGPEDGMPEESAATFDNLRAIRKTYLIDRICTLGELRMIEACNALAVATGCS